MVKRLPVRFWLTGILLFSFLLKLLYWQLDLTVSRDGCNYILLARIWYDSGNFRGIIDESSSFFSPPLFIYLMKCLMNLGISAETAGVCINLFLGTFTPLIAYGIAYEITQSRKVSVCSAFLTVVNPSMNALSVKVQRDMIYLFLAGVTIWLLLAGIRRMKWGYWLSAGLVCASAVLTRFEAMEFLLIAPIAPLILFIGKYCDWRKSICFAGIFFLSFAGGIFALSTLMHTNDYLFSNYERFFQLKMSRLEKPFSPESEMGPGR